MAVRTLSPITAPPILRHQRIFRCWYLCGECYSGNEFADEMLTAGISWCPACGAKCEPCLVEEFEEDRLEWED
jgi:hypothetical protein